MSSNNRNATQFDGDPEFVPTHRTRALAGDHGPQTLVGGPTVPPSAYRFLGPPIEPDEIGRLGQYRVLKPLGKGGMAFVFLAEDTTLHRRVALKVMRPELANEPTAAERFIREARTAAGIKHDNLITIFQVGQQGEVVYLAMELLQGETLDARVDRTGPPLSADVIRLGREMALGLDAIHRRGLVHRDIKPNNIWLEDRRSEGHDADRVRLLDFGLARHVEDDARYTKSGHIVGTPAFMSPEQARGQKLDARSDLFSLGGVLYYTCTGRLPFQGETTMAVLTALAICDPQPVTDFNRNVPRGLVDLINQLLAKDPARRPASAREIADRLLRMERNLDTVPLTPTPAGEWDFSETEILPAGPRSRKYAVAKKKAAARKRTLAWATGGGLAAVILVAMIVLIAGGSSKSEKTEKQDAFAKAAPSPSSPARKDLTSAAKTTPPAESRKAFLSDLRPIATKDWIKTIPQPKFGEPPPPALDGISLRGKVSPHGLFMHGPIGPNGGTTTVSYRIGKKYDLFQCQVTLNDGPPESDTPMTFTVYGDDKVLWRSRPVKSQDDTQTCNVSVKDVDTLTIELDCPGEPHAAHGAWIEPVLTAR